MSVMEGGVEVGEEPVKTPTPYTLHPTSLVLRARPCGARDGRWRRCRGRGGTLNPKPYTVTITPEPGLRFRVQGLRFYERDGRRRRGRGGCAALNPKPLNRRPQEEFKVWGKTVL